MERYFKPISQCSSSQQCSDKSNASNDVREEIGEVDVGVQSDEMNVDFENDNDDMDEIGVGDEMDDINVGEESDGIDVGEEMGEINLAQLPFYPGLRTPIKNYNVNIRDVIRRAYMQKGPCQPRNHEFQWTKKGIRDRRFCPGWFNDYPDWLEYSVTKNVVFCFFCYLFGSRRDTFVVGGYSNWKRKDKLKRHIGKPGSAHNQARVRYESFSNQEQSIEASLNKQSEKTRNEYQIRLTASIDCARYLLRQGLAFRGHDETIDSNNQGNFLELLNWLCGQNVDVKAVALKNAPANVKLTSPDIQKDIVSAIAFEIMRVIMSEVGDGFFSILVDESRDISMKEQMSVVLRYVKDGHVTERFIGIEHVSSTTSLSLKVAIEHLFSRYDLSISSLRGQGYDGASNMRGEYNGLKALILKENPSAYYIHCFAHQLQLALVAVANKHSRIDRFFHIVESVLNVVGGSAKRCDLLREKQRLKILEALSTCDILSGRGKNQETNLKRPGDTRWGSHYNCLLNLITMFLTTVDVIDLISTDSTATNCTKKGEASILFETMLQFEFVFSLHIMKKVLGISNELAKSLQRKDQDIVNAMRLVKICKQRLQELRDNEWDSFLETICSFSAKHNIDVPNMDDMYIPLGHSRRITVTNMHYFRVDMFYTVIDMQLQELNDRFSEVNSELLLCVACLCPNNSFSAFDKNKLIRMCEFYPKDFEAVEILELEEQLETYIIDMRTDEDLGGLQGLNELAQKLVEKGKT